MINAIGFRRLCALLICLGLTSVLLPMGCQKYGDVSPRSYDLAKALYAACNGKSTDRLARIESVIADSLQASEISDAEHDWLQSIVQLAAEGRWEDATRDARTMMSEQIRAD